MASSEQRVQVVTRETETEMTADAAASVETRPLPAENNHLPRTDRARLNLLARFELAVTACEVVADFITVILAAVLSYALYRSLELGKHAHYASAEHLFAVGGFALFFVLMLDRGGAYRPGNSLLRVKETERVLRVSAQSFLVILPFTFLAQFYFSRWLFLIAFALTPLMVALQKQAIHLAIRYLHLRGYGVRKVAIYGAGYTGRRVYSAMVRSPKLGLSPVAFFDNDPAKAGTSVMELGYQHRRSAPVIHGNPTKKMLTECDVTELVIAIPSISRERFLKVTSEAWEAGARISFVPGNFLSNDAPIEYANIDGLLLSSLGELRARPAYEASKRILDVVLSIVLLVLTAPLWLLLSILVRSDSKGPALFRQKRVGRDGALFDLYKFRTMYIEAPSYDYSPRAANDPRITRIGKYLRRTSLDELPQLLNVIRGEMSLVGPRPEMPFIVEQYDDRQRQRLQVKPGITGLWQLSADRAFLIHENIAYDVYYINNRGLFLDLAILIHTMLFAMRGI